MEPKIKFDYNTEVVLKKCMGCRYLTLTRYAEHQVGESERAGTIYVDDVLLPDTTLFVAMCARPTIMGEKITPEEAKYLRLGNPVPCDIPRERPIGWLE